MSFSTRGVVISVEGVDRGRRERGGGQAIEGKWVIFGGGGKEGDGTLCQRDI